MASDAESGVQAALAELEQARQSSYYDEAADAQSRTAYYAGIDPMTSAEDLFGALSALVIGTHANRPEYKPHLHLYPHVDLHPDGMLRSIYTGEVYDPVQLIAEGARIDQRREELRARQLAGVEALTEEALLAVEAQMDQQAPYNCEHVVPQSWFRRKEPMRGDLHHLFTCERKCNEFRASNVFFDFPPLREVKRSGCGKMDTNRFEPGQGKGEVARATLYFLVRYPAAIVRTKTGLDEERMAVLLSWHEAFPVSEYERRRNAAIQAKQGNRNPFLDEPRWVERAAVSLGLG